MKKLTLQFRQLNTLPIEDTHISCIISNNLRKATPHTLPLYHAVLQIVHLILKLITNAPMLTI